jgi:AcrR family transcriptional regulator
VAFVTLFEDRTVCERSGIVTPVTVLTRRAQQQKALRRDVIEAALVQLDEGGSAAVNWRGLARTVGVSPSTLYTYFDSLDALYTALILEVYGEMAAEVRRTVDPGASPADRLREACAGYRRYALRHPARFTLVFTDVLPGYAAPENGPTIAAQVEVFQPLIEGFAELIGRSDIDVASWSAADRSRALGAWSQLHGFVSLEVNHHFVWIDDVDAEFERTIEQLL